MKGLNTKKLIALWMMGVVVLSFPYPVKAQEEEREDDGVILQAEGVLEEGDKTLEDGSLYDVYTFEGKAGDSVGIFAQSEDFDTYLILVDAEGNKVGENDDFEGTNAGIFLMLPNNGLYGVLVNNYNPENQGDYEISISKLNTEDLKKIKLKKIIQDSLEKYQNQQYNQSIEILQEALIISREISDLPTESSVLHYLGLVFQTLQQYQEAIIFYQKALNNYRILDDVSGQADIFNHLGLIYISLKQEKEALKYFQEALIINRKISHRFEEAKTLSNLGNVYNALGEYEQAINNFKKALEIYSEINPDERKAIIDYAKGSTLGNLAGVYFNLNDYKKAIEFYHQALSIAEEIGDWDGKATIFNGLGAVYDAVGQYQVALNYYQNALEISKQIKDYSGEASILNNLGLVYSNLGQYEKSLESYGESLKIQHRLGIYNNPTILNNLGSINYKSEKYKEAIVFYEQALEVSRKNGYRSEEATALNNLGIIYDRADLYYKAINFHYQSLAIYRAIGNFSGQGSALNNLGGLYFTLKEYDQSLSYYQESLEINRQIGDRVAEAIAIGNQSFVLLQLNKLKEAENNIFEAIKIFESLSKQELDDADKITFFDTYVSSYLYFQKILIEQDKILPALEVAERGRASAFKELLNQRFSNQTVQIQNPTIDQIRQTAKEQNASLVQYSLIQDKSGQYSELYIWVIQPTGEIDFRSVNLKDNNIDIDDLVARALAAISSNKDQFDRSNDNRTEIAFSSNNLAPGDLIYLQGDPVGGGTPWKIIDIDPQTNTLTVTNLGWNSPNTTRERPISQVTHKTDLALRQLHQLLIDPIADLLPTDPNDKVIFIPQESLFLLPFPVLLDENYQYLINHHTILTAPSIQALDLINSNNSPSTNINSTQTVIVGNPLMPSISRSVDTPATPLSPLANAEKEAQAIATMLNAQALTGSEATKETVLKLLPQAKIIHLATHGLLEYGNPQRSGVRDFPGAIALAPDPNFQPELGEINGLLTAGEIFDLNLNADLVVLSACDTGRGELTGDGVIGLSRSFLSAGAESVMVSLWSVDDQSTADLMTEFYRQWQTNQLDKAQALRQAMLTTMEKHPNPYYWAAFTLIGESD